MRLLYVINNLKLGGAEKRVVDLINGLGPEFSLGLACLQLKGDLVNELKRNELSVYDLGIGDEHQFWAGIERLMNIVDNFKPCLLHTHLVQASLIGRMAALPSRIPTISTQHHAHHAKDYTPLYRLERSTWSLSSGFIALSASIEKTLRSSGYLGPVEVIHTGIKSEPTFSAVANAEESRCPYILSVGQFRDEQKGHDILVKSFRRVSEVLPAYKLYLVGDGPEKEKIESLVASLGLTSSVYFLGERVDVLDLMNGCSLFVLASRWEGLGRVILEAMSVGCAIVATGVEGIPEIISSGQDGFLVSPGNIAELARCIILLLKDDDLRESLGVAAKRTVSQRFAVSRMIEREVEFYGSLCGRG